MLYLPQMQHKESTPQDSPRCLLYLVYILSHRTPSFGRPPSLAHHDTHNRVDASKREMIPEGDAMITYSLTRLMLNCLEP